MRRNPSPGWGGLVLAIVVCVACQPSDSTTTLDAPPSMPSVRATAPTSTTTIPSTTATTVLTTTTTSPVVTTTTVRGCDGGAATIPAEATEHVSIRADADGDGVEDEVTGYLSQGSSYLHVRLGSGFGISIRVDDLFDSTGSIPISRPVGVVRMSGDPLIMVQGRAILVGSQYAFFSSADCGLQPVTLSGGGMPEIWTGGGAGHADWFTCGSDGVVMRQFTLDDPAADPQVYTGATATAFSYAGSSFEELGSVDPGVVFPISRPDLLAALPPCAP
jgi:hypothetical protein